jgi:voltage-gated potassium channel
LVDQEPKHQEASSAALDRIHRLERQERDRLDRELATADRRAQLTDERRGPTDPRREKLKALEHAIRFPMAVLGVAWAVCGIVVLTTHASGATSRAFVISLFVIWVVVFLEAALRYIAVSDRRRYFASRQIEPVLVVLPFFQIWRILGVERATVLWGEGVERFLAILGHRGLFRVLLAAVGLLFLGAWLVLLFEKNAAGSNIHSYHDALWWAVVTVTTVGYGDRFPISEGGRAVAVILMLVGIGLIGVLTATVASFFVAEHTDANKDLLKASHEDLGARLDEIDSRLARMEAVLVGSSGPAAAPAVDATAAPAATRPEDRSTVQPDPSSGAPPSPPPPSAPPGPPSAPPTP